MAETSEDTVLPEDDTLPVTARPATGGLPADRWLWPALITLAVVGGCAFLILAYQVVTAQAEQRDWKNVRGTIEAQLLILRKAVDTANTEVAALAGKKQDLGQQVVALDRERVRKEGEVQRLKAELDTFNGRRTALAEQVAEREKHEQDLLRRVAPLEKRVHDLEQQRDRATSDLATAKAQLSQLRAKPQRNGKQTPAGVTRKPPQRTPASP